MGGNASTVRFDNVTRDSQTQPETIGGARTIWSTSKAIKDVGEKILTNATTRIGYGDLRTLLSFLA
jgi:hypothetical protein